MRKIILMAAAITAIVVLIEGVAKSDDRYSFKPCPLLTGNEPLPDAPYYPGMPGIIVGSPGDTAGTTPYDLQCLGSTGHRITVRNGGMSSGVHFTWMGYSNYPSNRNVYYNFKNAMNDWTFIEGIPVFYRNGDGFAQISATSDNRAAIAYHNALAGSESLYCAIDVFEGLGVFNYYHPNIRFGPYHGLWPKISIDRRGTIQMLATANYLGKMIIGYTRSTNDGTTWTSAAQVDTVATVSAIITSSPVSNKSAIAYLHPADSIAPWKGDIFYIQSADGRTWDFAGDKVNITEYGTNGDSLFAYPECDVVYDYNDNLHVIWNASYVSDSNGILYNSKLLHFSSSPEIISQIAQFDSVWPGSRCNFGTGNSGFSKMSIGADSSNDLFVVYTSWDSSDCSIGGFANGDLYLNYSTDGGLHWSDNINITNSQTPDCDAGNCDSDVFPSLAEKVDTLLYIFYVNDKDAGSIPYSEGAITDNPLLYLPFPNPTRYPNHNCLYIRGDINNDATFNGLDVTFAVLFLTGEDHPTYRCGCPIGFEWYVAGDANGDCRFNSIDIVYMVNRLKGGPALRNCPDCPPGM